MKGLRGEIIPPFDKSVSHRAVLFASLAEGKSTVRNFLRAADPLSTVRALKMLGVEMGEAASGELVIQGKGLYGLKESPDVLDCGNSGTTMRLLSGILSGNPFFSVLTGDDSLRQRPMARVIEPLKEMHADISGRGNDRYAPIAIRGKALKPVDYTMPVASAQVKSCLVLAGLYADGITSVKEPYKSRDHTERMLGAMGADIDVAGLTVKIRGGSRLSGCELTVPSDFSSAAFFIAAALIIPESEICVKGVGVNPTRTGFMDVIREMGAEVELVDAGTVSGEPVADIWCRTSNHMKGICIGKERVPSLIDEFPVLCVLATQAEGITEIRGAEELRVKESDRIKTMAEELRKFGVETEEYPDGIAIKGKAVLKGSDAESYGDHRIAMSLAVAALIAEGTTKIRNASSVDISFPGFFDELKRLSRG
ncbi:MAG TPA: 3-phosphoshikimate 1-carboxyvinyltransferase [Thermodesulfovibrionales bacterium]|nr:3-phosphoshikimate 1-carboxyvinyltransferase [Thermodesulfovibrionales bacterium]